MKEGKLIVIDGIDGAGKATQVALLVKRLKRRRIKAQGLDFPQYETFFGRLVTEYLKGDFGTLDPKVASLLYGANRLEFKDKISNWLKGGYTVVLNRYVSSNQIHQAANIESKKQRRLFVKWIAKMEYGNFGLPMPDLILFLNLPAEVSYQQVLKKTTKARKYIAGTKRDILESDLEHQRRALKQAHEALKSYGPKSKIVECFDKQLLSKQEIGDKIWQHVSKLIK
ncbi:MAG: hypothetical protein A3H72_01500 [Candidatus Doudnabacteria bacterium RIFCSPLOWO2_02_FULL_48_8]|uniref:Thymidylate kinase n=1 Tax=Candidatus Doudnabacteria bacterium RIFCSPHIGHO2_01_FULL_46_24 TaxID=1817825 RepID=A0A1F5NTV5_9BACT|nr:MAG: hypothetical protein A2720_01020 [Candidatus Doudnabacteria bacterium RIFCSPHIGHO2_01_FULL_46_24]OGE95423.1 MAG: hypothetical protein A3H72_01500 [Candidatus Doudnabacteria bacterium RIFCSPLOWO2_02_FULL_48_8]OGE95474.1 MAG: hypothetical protein A3E98_01105 [Candidatus Doudnabacteria bacterium RIFCSPHIGHO2_12_FULL_48_11]